MGQAPAWVSKPSSMLVIGGRGIASSRQTGSILVSTQCALMNDITIGRGANGFWIVVGRSMGCDVLADYG